MERNNKLLLTATAWHQSSAIVLNALLFVISMFCATQSIAETNAQGIQIEFISDSDDMASEVLAEIVTPAVDKQALLEQTPTPEITPFDNNLWLRMQQGYAMPTITSPYTTKYENWYASRPDYVDKMMARSQKYLFYVVEEVEKRGMPTEIALLPMIESAYNPRAYSRSHAAGIWQFIPNTGTYFGLQQNWWVDHRRDVTAATQAALDYLEKLHGMFGSWDLALAAYNAGEGTVGRAINRNQKSGLPTDYQSLKLPLETAQYVPKLQAIKNIVTNPEQYGLNIALIPNQAYFAETDAPSQIDARIAANLAEISHEEFALLNPSYNRPVIASKNNSHKLLLPVSAVDRFQNNLNNYDKSLISWKVYKAKSGEYMANIAKKFNMTLSRLRDVNGLPKNKKIQKSLHLLVPAEKSDPNKINVATLARQKSYDQGGSLRHVTHKIKRGETLSTLAIKYGTNTKDLMKINRLKSTRIRYGQIIKIYEESTGDKTKKI